MMKPVSCCATLLFLIAHNLLGIARVVQSQSACRLAFDLLDDISNEYTNISATVGGASLSPTLDDPVRPLGQLYVVVPTEGGACPEGGQAWLQRLQDGASIGLETNGTIMLTPNPLVVSVAALGSLSIADVELVQSGRLQPRGEGREAALDFELVGGSVAGVDLADANATSSTVTAAEFSLSQGEVLMSFPNLTLTIPIALGGFAVEMELRGSQAALSDSGATAPAASAGPLPLPPPSEEEEEEEEEEAPEPGSSPLLDTPAPVAAGGGREEAVELRVDLDAQLAASLTDRENTCLMGARGIVDENDDACSCESGWEGDQCQTCTSDGACRAFLSRSNAECRSDPQFFPDTQMKAYTCNLPESVASVVGTDVSFMCVTVDNPYLGLNGTLERLERLMQLPAGALSGTSGDGLQYGKQCRVDLSVSDTPLSCAGVGCNFGVGGASALCEMAECKCRKGQEAACDPTVVQLANSLVLRGVQLKEVDAGNGQFFLGLQGPGDSQLGAQLLCEVSDCACKDQVCGEVLTDEEIADGNETDWWVPLITAGPLMVLLAIAIANAVAIGAQWRLFANHLAGRGSEFTGAWTDLDQDMPLKQEPWGERTGKGERGELCLRWRNVSCVVARGTKRILDAVSGEAWEGELLGILGPSGSGKSTLLSIISGSRQDVSPDAQVTGRIELGGTALRTSRLAKAAAFVPQEDDLLPCLTVQETLRYAALLQLPQDYSPEVISQRINDVMADLGIAKVANQRVGGRGGVRGISGGERRRVTIAMEMLPDPKLLLMDEPTSGLDSYTARRLLITCRHIAERGRVVVASIHQPSPEMFSMLDRVMLMSSGCSLFYGRPEAAEGFFQDARLPVPPGRAVADHMMAVACMPGACQHIALGSRGGSDELRQTEPVANGEPGGRMVELVVCDSGARMSSAPQEPAALTATQPTRLASPSSGGSDAEAGDSRGKSSPEFAEVALEAEGAAAAAAVPPMSPLSPLPGSEPLDMSGRSSHSKLPQAGWGREMAVLFWRGSLDIGRNRGLLVLHIVLALVMGVLVGVTFLDQKLDRDGAQNRLGAMFFTLCLFAFNAITSVDLLLSERSLVSREVVAGYYGVVPYMLTKLTLDGLLLRVVPVLLYSMLMYPLIDLQNGNVEVATFLLVLSLFAATIGALTIACTAVLRTPGQVLVVLNFVLLISVMMGGYLVNKDSIAAGIKWLHYAQPFSFSFALVATNELKSLLLNISIADIGSADITGGLLLTELGITTDQNTLYAWVLVAFYVGYASIALLALWARIRAGHWLYRVLGRGAKAAR